MASTNQDGTIYRGADAELEITVTDENGDALDLAGKDVHYRVAISAGSATSALHVEQPEITTAGNVATVPITYEQSEALVPTSRVGFYHELYLEDSGVRSVVMTGRLTVLPAQVAQHD